MAIDERIVINPAEIAEAISAITKERNNAQDAMDAITREYNILNNTLQSDTLGAANEFQRVAEQILATVDETIVSLQRVMNQYSESSQEIDGRGATGISNI